TRGHDAIGANDRDARRDVLRNDGIRADDRALPDPDVAQHASARPDVDVIAYDRRDALVRIPAADQHLLHDGHPAADDRLRVNDDAVWLRHVEIRRHATTNVAVEQHADE